MSCVREAWVAIYGDGWVTLIFVLYSEFADVVAVRMYAELIDWNCESMKLNGHTVTVMFYHRDITKHVSL